MGKIKPIVIRLEPDVWQALTARAAELRVSTGRAHSYSETIAALLRDVVDPALQPHGVIALYREKNAAIHARLEVALSDELGSRVVPELVEQLAVDAEKRAAGQT